MLLCVDFHPIYLFGVRTVNDRAFDDDGLIIPLKGGSTSFPPLNLTVKPKKGDAIFWTNKKIDGTMDERVLHAGEPVTE